MHTKDFKDTIEYLQEDNNAAINAWREFLADIIGIVTVSGETNESILKTIEELSNLRGILNKLKR